MVQMEYGAVLPPSQMVFFSQYNPRYNLRVFIHINFSIIQGLPEAFMRHSASDDIFCDICLIQGDFRNVSKERITFPRLGCIAK